ncbi:MAG: insulinase family protein [Chitinophagales bacterium]
MKQILVWWTLVIAGFQLSAQSMVAATNYNISLSQNGLNSVCVYAPQLPVAEVSLTIRSGSIYERQEQRGLANLLHEVIAGKINTSLQSGKYPNIRFSSEAGVEVTTFRFKTIHSELQRLLDFIAQHVVKQKFVDEEVRAAIDATNTKRIEFNTGEQHIVKRTMQQQLFKFDLDKVNVWGDSATTANYTVIDVDSFYRLYYSPVASTILIQSNYQPYSLLTMLERSFSSWLKVEFNPDEFTKIRSVKPLIYSTQHPLFTSPSEPKITLSTLSFGGRNYTHGSYYSFLLNALLNDTTQPIFKELKEETGVRKIQASYEVDNYYGIFSITVYPPEGRHQEVYDLLRKSITEIHRYIDENSVAAAKKKFAKEYADFKGTSPYFNESVRHFFSNSTEYFETLNDSVQSIKTAQFLRNVYTDFCNANFAAIAEIDSTHYSNEQYNSWFATIDESIGDEKFTYRKNICEVEGDANTQLLNRLLQWLKVNPDMQCQINGKADKGEFDKFKDEAVWAFIDTIETFRKYKPDLLKTGIMRPELLRSLKILRALSEGGIALERLKGTAITLGSKTKEEEADNRSATITLTRLKNRLPIRDIRLFGK